MKTILENNRAVGSSAYFGERGHWLIAAAVHRDSDTLSRSNWISFGKALEAMAPVTQGWIIERFHHWAVGWIDYLIIDPSCTALVAEAERLRASLEDYPVLDEEHWSQLEDDEAQTIWRDCFRDQERVKYIREHRNQFEFRDFADMLGCARGKYFCGYASELCSA